MEEVDRWGVNGVYIIDGREQLLSEVREHTNTPGTQRKGPLQSIMKTRFLKHRFSLSHGVF